MSYIVGKNTGMDLTSPFIIIELANINGKYTFFVKYKKETSSLYKVLQIYEKLKKNHQNTNNIFVIVNCFSKELNYNEELQNKLIKMYCYIKNL